MIITLHLFEGGHCERTGVGEGELIHERQSEARLHSEAGKYCGFHSLADLRSQAARVFIPDLIILLPH